MSSLASPRGPLPPRVYWVRRAFALAVLLLVLLLLIGVVKMMFGGGNDTGSATGTAQQAAGEQKPAQAAPTAAATGATQAPVVEPTAPVQAQPNGRCTPADVELSPSVTNAVAGAPVAVTLTARTRRAAACVWRFAPQNVMVKIAKGKTAVWSSTACKDWVPTQTVVLRAESTTNLQVTWNGRRSDTGCSAKYSDFARAGTYQVLAAALGGDDASAEFGLRAPTEADLASAATTTTAATSTSAEKASASPSARATTGATGRGTGAPSARSSTPVSQKVDPTAKPSGAVEPN